MTLNEVVGGSQASMDILRVVDDVILGISFVD
jgi:hypothetical protein